MSAVAASIRDGFRNGYACGMDYDSEDGGFESAAEAAFAAEYPDLHAILSGSAKTPVAPVTLQRARDRWEAFFTGADSFSGGNALTVERAGAHFQALYPADAALLTEHAPSPPPRRVRPDAGSDGDHAMHLGPGETIEVLAAVSIDNGGPAFPSEQSETQDGCWNQTYEPGMSLRDYFAGQVLAGSGRVPTGPDSCRIEAFLAYQMADAMLAARRSP